MAAVRTFSAYGFTHRSEISLLQLSSGGPGVHEFTPRHFNDTRLGEQWEQLPGTLLSFLSRFVNWQLQGEGWLGLKRSRGATGNRIVQHGLYGRLPDGFRVHAQKAPGHSRCFSPAGWGTFRINAMVVEDSGKDRGTGNGDM